jgi:glycosyltransferase involved in cell wall biosynthesis
MAAQAALLEAVAERVQLFDVLHFHIDWLHLPLLSRLQAPFLSTFHNRLDLPGFSDLVARFPRAHFVSISDNQRIPVKEANWLGTVYHGLPTQSLRPSFKQGNYLAFLGRLTADKGPEAAIRIAKRAGLPLRIAAKIPRADMRYFAEKIAPQVDNRRVKLVGEVDDKAKQDFLSDAAGLLFPIDWPEPFGLVMIEAMACGTPIIAFRRGSVPEVVEDGVTGFVVETEEEAAQAVTRLNEIDRKQVRAAFETRFSARRMAENYVRHYNRLTQCKR